MENVNLLKLMAKEEKDLKVLSACLQDSLVPINEIHYNKGHKQCILLLNRYRWEAKESNQRGTRIHASLSFDHVTKVQFTGFDRQKTPLLQLSLLSLHYEEPYVYITFSDHASLRLQVEDLKIKLRDADVTWPALTPSHFS